MIRVLTMVASAGSRWTAEVSMPVSRSDCIRRAPGGSSPARPITPVAPVSSWTLRATLAAPPGKYDSEVTLTTGTGASGEMRDTFPQTNSSSMRSPITRMRLPANRSTSAWRRPAPRSADNRLARSASFALEVRAIALARQNEERQPGPWNQRVETAPDPHGLVENLQHHAADFLRAEQFAVRPPGRRAGLVEVERLLHRKALRFEQLAGLAYAKTAPVSHASVERAEKPLAVRRKHDQLPVGLERRSERRHHRSRV